MIEFKSIFISFRLAHFSQPYNRK